MAFTNRHTLPDEIVSALTKNRYNGASESEAQRSNYSVTQLIAPIQQTILKKRYPEAGQQDVIDNLWSMFGSIAHSLLEEHGSDDSLVEKRFYTTILDRVISGGVDHFKNGIITDYKVTSAWKVSKKNYTDWENQLNAYAYLIENSQQVCVEKIRVIAILRDWSEQDSHKPDYPKAPIEIIDIPMWPDWKRSVYLSDRVRLLKMAEQSTDDSLLECTIEEMWANPNKYAVQKPDAKRATKVFDTEEEAYNYTLDNPAYIIVERKGERRRCAKYCQASSVCHQYQTYLKEIEDATSKSESGSTPF